MHFNFAAGNYFDLKILNSIESFVDNYTDFQTVWLADENELNLLLSLIGIHTITGRDTDGPFCKYWDLSDYKLPEFDSKGFDKFYHNWLQISKRDSNMNEYGSLIFLSGLSPEWNRVKYRFVVKENSNGY